MVTSILENTTQITQLDGDNLLSGITALPEQMNHAWQETKKISFPKTIIENVVVAGMGGSGLGADIAISALSERQTAPIQIVHDYSLPNYISAKTLVILASFSGTTEEILSCAKQAEAAQAQIAVISAGGALLELAQKNNYPYYHIEPTYNRSTQQRMALGYALVGMLGMLSQAGFCPITDQEMVVVVTAVKDMVIRCSTEQAVIDNPAKHLAFELIDHQPYFIGAEFLAGALHTTTNQLNENAKIFAQFAVIPELNHHLLEGIQYPADNDSRHFFVFIDSDLYLKNNHDRLELTQELVESLDVPSLLIKLHSSTKLAQSFELLTLGSFTSIYLALLEGFDPGPLPIVDRFKTQLKAR